MVVPVSDAQYLAGARIQQTRLLDKALPSAATMHIVNTFVQDRRLAIVPVTIFEESMNQALYKLARPPSRKHAGTRLREARQFPTIAPVFHHWMSIVRGLPHYSPGENIERNVFGSMHPQGAPLIPIKETENRRLFKVKLMRQDAVMAFASLDLYQPKFAVRATRLLVKPASAGCEARARALCMLAGPLTVKMFEPIGKAKQGDQAPHDADQGKRAEHGPHHRGGELRDGRLLAHDQEMAALGVLLLRGDAGGQRTWGGAVG